MSKKKIAAAILMVMATASAPSATLYYSGLTSIPTSNTQPTSPIEKFFASAPSMYLTEKTELCHGTQVKKGVFTDTRYDMYVVRSGGLEKASNGLVFRRHFYSQFNDDAITMTFSWDAENGAGVDKDERIVKSMYEGICAQSSVTIRTKAEQLEINELNTTRKPPEPDPCPDEIRRVADLESKISKAKVEAYLDQRDALGGSSTLRRIEVETMNATAQGQHNVIMQSLLAEKASAVEALDQCRNLSKTKTSTVDPLDQLRKLKALLDDKIITQEEFNIKKASLLK